MKLLIIILAIGLSASSHAGFKLLTMDEVAVDILTSPELIKEKSDEKITSMKLSSLRFDTTQKPWKAFLKYESNGAPCTVVVEFSTKNTVPAGAHGVNMMVVIDDIETVCALN